MAMTIGCTIREAQERISVREFNVWIRYRTKYGPMNPVRRYDMGPAIVASMISRVNGRRASALDFLPYGKDPEPDVDVDEDGFLAALAGRAKDGRK